MSNRTKQKTHAWVRQTAIVLGVAAILAGGHVQAQSVTIAMAATANTIDPHFQNTTPNNSVINAIYDRLVERTADGKLVPSLAVSWKTLSPKVWEFKLRDGVKWHNGSDFTADDVLFTIERIPEVPNSPGRYDGYLRAVDKVEVVDRLTLRIHTKEVAPLLPNNLNNVSIVSREATKTATTADFNSGKAAIGTGPYKLVRYVPGERVDFARNEDWWGGTPAWKQASIRFIPNAGARTAALLSGSVDLIDGVPSNDIARLKTSSGVSVFSVGGFRSVFVMLNHISPNGGTNVADASGKPLQSNPFHDIRVRRALSVAIDRNALAQKIMLDTVEPTGQFLPPGTPGYASSVGIPKYDPAEARRLLAEAGYPDGLTLTLHTPQDRYPNDVIMAQTVAQMWTQAGIKTAVQAVPNVSYNKVTTKQGFSVGISGYGNARGDPSDLLVNSVHSYNAEAGTGNNNHGRYSNSKLDELINKSLATLEDAPREKQFAEAVELVTNDFGVIPLYNQNWIWAGRSNIKYEARKDGFTLLRAATPAK